MDFFFTCRNEPRFIINLRAFEVVRSLTHLAGMLEERTPQVNQGKCSFDYAKSASISEKLFRGKDIRAQALKF
jgi:hypothetical protein